MSILWMFAIRLINSKRLKVYFSGFVFILICLLNAWGNPFVVLFVVSGVVSCYVTALRGVLIVMRGLVGGLICPMLAMSSNGIVFDRPRVELLNDLGGFDFLYTLVMVLFLAAIGIFLRIIYVARQKLHAPANGNVIGMGILLELSISLTLWIPVSNGPEMLLLSVLGYAIVATSVLLYGGCAAFCQINALSVHRKVPSAG
jgi:hypothetical protein